MTFLGRIFPARGMPRGTVHIIVERITNIVGVTVLVPPGVFVVDDVIVLPIGTHVAAVTT